MRRKNRRSLFFHACYFICSVPQSLFFFLVSIGMLLRYLLLMSGQSVSCSISLSDSRSLSMTLHT